MKTAKPILTFTKARITENVEIAPSVFLLSFRRSFSFQAGQIIGIRLQDDEPQRLYSIASGEDEDIVSVLFDINPKGLLTPRLAKRKAGDYLYHTQPFGYFLSGKGPATWIATGTGIAPFRSMLRSGHQESKTLIHGARSLPFFFFKDEFEARFEQRYIPCSSSQVLDKTYFGRVTQYLRDIESLNLSAKYLLCGSAEMVVEVRDILISKEVPFENIRAEIYF